MDIGALLNGIHIENIQHGDADNITAVSIDSRKVTPGCLYICLNGNTFDGHKFIPEAASKGAAAVLIQERQENYPPGLYVLQAENTRSAMSRIAANFYNNPASKMRLIGVTGTKGKTSTTHFIETILEEANLSTGIIGTIGTRAGETEIDVPFNTTTTPDPLDLQNIFSQMLKLNVSDVVMEVSSHALALEKTNGLNYAVGVFTNLTHDHLDFHVTMENYRDAKSRLFNQVRFGVVNADDPVAPFMMKGKNASHWLTYGINSECDLQAEHIEYLPGGSSFDVDIDGSVSHFYLPVKGRYNIYNCLAAIGTALALEIPIETIKRGISNIKGIPGRIQSVPNGIGAQILVDYAHTPDSLVNVINAVREFTTGKLVVLFGCGGDRDIQKRPMMGRISGELADFTILTSDNPRSESPEEIIRQIETGITETNSPYEIYINRRDAIRAGIKMLNEGDAFIIAGKGHEKYQLIGEKTLHFDDVEIALEALGEENEIKS